MGKIIRITVTAILALCAQVWGLGAEAQECTADMVGKQSCQAGSTVQCAKHFDMTAKAMLYTWDYMNASGQTFRVDQKLMNTTPGYTPASCTGKDVAESVASKKKTG